jgi:hypothetical protein
MVQPHMSSHVNILACWCARRGIGEFRRSSQRWAVPVRTVAVAGLRLG